MFMCLGYLLNPVIFPMGTALFLRSMSSRYLPPKYIVIIRAVDRRALWQINYKLLALTRGFARVVLLILV